MKFVPEQVHRMAQTIEPAADALRSHAQNIANTGFEPGHTGRDYLEQGKSIAAGVDGIVGMLHSWSDASKATTDAMHHAVSSIVTTDDRNRASIAAANSQLGSA